MKQCCYVLEAAAPGKDAVYCNKPTTYKMVRDDDDEKSVRKYNSFCAAHDEPDDVEGEYK